MKTSEFRVKAKVRVGRRSRSGAKMAVGLVAKQVWTKGRNENSQGKNPEFCLMGQHQGGEESREMGEVEMMFPV